MREIWREPEGTLRERWMRSSRALSMILLLPRETWPRLFSGLCDYVRWLLEEERDAEKLEEFSEDLANAETYLKEKLEAGELIEKEADQRRGDMIWWKAQEEIHDAALRIAVEIIIDRDLLAFFTKQPPSNNKTLDEVQEEVELRLANKLRECVNISGIL